MGIFTQFFYFKRKWELMEGLQQMSVYLLLKQKKNKKSVYQLTEGTSKITKWKSCTLTHEPLRTPVVCDYIGNLYNKDAIIERLLKVKKTGNSMPSGFHHIRNL